MDELDFEFPSDPMWDHYAGTFAWECSVCDLMGCADTETGAKVQVYQHVARAHPILYESITGEYPSEERIQDQTYLILEGFT